MLPKNGKDATPEKTCFCPESKTFQPVSCPERKQSVMQCVLPAQYIQCGCVAVSVNCS